MRWNQLSFMGTLRARARAFHRAYLPAAVEASRRRASEHLAGVLRVYEQEKDPIAAVLTSGIGGEIDRVWDAAPHEAAASAARNGPEPAHPKIALAEIAVCR